MIKLATVPFKMLKMSPAGRYMPTPEGSDTAVMESGGKSCTIRVSATLAERASVASGKDCWSATAARVGADGKDLPGAYSFKWSSSTGFRVEASLPSYIDNSGAGFPVQPGARALLVSIGNDIKAALGMPHSSKAAARHVQTEFGYENVAQAMQVVECLRECADGVTAMLGGAATLGEFAEWTRKIEALREPIPRPDAFSFALPVVDAPDGTQVAGHVKIAFRPAQNDKTALTVDGEPVAEDAMVISVIANLRERDGARGLWREASAGQCADTVRSLWADFPEVVELCDIWDRWHLNGMKAGTRAQMEVISGLPARMSHSAMREALNAAGVLSDPALLVQGKPYSYGSRWLHEPLPAEVPERLRELAAAIPAAVPSPAADGPRPPGA